MLLFESLLASIYMLDPDGNITRSLNDDDGSPTAVAAFQLSNEDIPASATLTDDDLAYAWYSPSLSCMEATHTWLRLSRATEGLV